MSRLLFLMAAAGALAGYAFCAARETQPMKSQAVVDAAVEDIRADGRLIQRLWWENDRLLFSLCGPGVLDVYAKKSPALIGRRVFAGADGEPRAPEHQDLVALTPQGESCGAVAWVCSVDAADRKKLLRPWGYNSFSDDSRKGGYGAISSFQARRPKDGEIYCDAVLASVATPAGPVHAFLGFTTRAGENLVRMHIGSPDRLYRQRRGDPKAERFRNLRIGLALAKLPGEKGVRRGDNYISVYSEPPSGEAKKVALALIYDKADYKAYAETSQDGGNRVVYFGYQPRKNFRVRAWLAVGSDIDGSATTAGQWENHVKGLTRQFTAELAGRANR